MKKFFENLVKNFVETCDCYYKSMNA